MSLPESLQLTPETLASIVRLANQRGITPKALIEETLNSLYGTGKAVFILDLSNLGRDETVEVAIKRPKTEKSAWYRRIWRRIARNQEASRRMAGARL